MTVLWLEQQSDGGEPRQVGLLVTAQPIRKILHSAAKSATVRGVRPDGQAF